jgi:hypothetical protein
MVIDAGLGREDHGSIPHNRDREEAGNHMMLELISDPD